MHKIVTNICSSISRRRDVCHVQKSLAAQGLEVLMDNVTAVGFTSCALQHNAKLPDLALPGGLGGDAHKAQAGTNNSSPSAGDKAVGGAHLHAIRIVEKV